jgi:hypothetical protein
LGDFIDARQLVMRRRLCLRSSRHNAADRISTHIAAKIIESATLVKVMTSPLVSLDDLIRK